MAQIPITEQQRAEVIRCCDGITEANAKLQQACRNILRILDNGANGRDPKDGIPTA
jgi:hypothetical protein